MELKENFKTNSPNPYDSDRPMNYQNTDQPYPNHQMDDNFAAPQYVPQQ